MKTAVCAAIIRRAEILLVRKKQTWILPGGKPESGEYPWQTLKRELLEELPRANCSIGHRIGEFEGITPHSGYEIQVIVFSASLKGDISPGSEISESRYVRDWRQLNVSEPTAKTLTWLEQEGYL